MLTKNEIDYICLIKNSHDVVKHAKITCKKLEVITNRINNLSKNDCFCSIVRRKIFIKDFFIWYENRT